MLRKMQIAARHTSTQRCDLCTRTHAQTQLAQRYDRCCCKHLHSDTIAAIAHIYTAIPSLSLHAPTQRYDRCHCRCQHSDTIAVSEHTSTHTPTQQFNHCTSTQTHTAIRSLQLSNSCSNMTASACVQVSCSHFFNYPTLIQSRRSWQDQLHHILGSTHRLLLPSPLFLPLPLPLPFASCLHWQRAVQLTTAL